MGALIASVLTLAVQQIESRRAERKAEDRRREAKTAAYETRVQQRNALVARAREAAKTPTSLSFRDDPKPERSLQTLRLGTESAPASTVQTSPTGLNI